MKEWARNAQANSPATSRQATARLEWAHGIEGLAETGSAVIPMMLSRLDRVQRLVLVVIPLGLLHHADHVGRADHSSWPFRPEIGPFTFTLLIYPVLVLVLLAPRGHWLRVAGLGLVSLFTLLAHTLIEPPQQIYRTWAENMSTPAPLYSVDPEHMHNLFGIESPVLGALATGLSIVLTGLLLVAWAVAIRDAADPARQHRDQLRDRW